VKKFSTIETVKEEENMTGNQSNIQKCVDLMDQKLSSYRMQAIQRPTQEQSKTIADLQQLKTDIDEMLALLEAS
jgi:hypothetical protein